MLAGPERLRAPPARGVRHRRAAPQRHRVGRDRRRDRAARACARSASSSATVPASFPLLLADRLRAAGHRADVPTASCSTERRRVEDRRRARRHPPRAGRGRGRRWRAARDLLRRAARTATARSSSTASRSRASASRRRSRSVFVAARRDRRRLHRLARRRSPRSATTWARADLRAGEPIVIDLWPRDNESACFADMTRTFVVGDVPDEIAEWHRSAREALEHAIARRSARASTGESSTTGRATIFEARGLPDAAHEGRGRDARGGLLPLARPRRRPRGARAADARHDGPRRARRRRRGRDRARPATARATAAAASRISCS